MSRVETLIEKVMAEHPRETPRAIARYYEAVHRELAPLARDLERELNVANQQVDDLVVLVRRLVLALRKASPDNEVSDAAMDYLKSNGLTSHQSVLRQI